MAEALKTPEGGGVEKQVQMGVGEAIKRLIAVEMRFRNGMAGQEALDERDMIIEALDQFQLDIGFDCDTDGVPDTVEIFEQSAATSCCRILPTDTSRRYAGKKAGTSRKTKPRLKRSASPAGPVKAATKPDTAKRKVTIPRASTAKAKAPAPKLEVVPPPLPPEEPPPLPPEPKAKAPAKPKAKKVRKVVRKVVRKASTSRAKPKKPKK